MRNNGAAGTMTLMTKHDGGRKSRSPGLALGGDGGWQSGLSDQC